MRKQQSENYGVGSIVAIPLANGEFCLGQIIGFEREILSCVAMALFDIKFDRSTERGDLAARIGNELVFSAILVTPELLDSGKWSVIGSRGVSWPKTKYPYESTRSSGFVGAVVRGAGIVEMFVNAFFGLAPWDRFYDPNYLDSFLVNPAKRPDGRLVLSK